MKTIIFIESTERVWESQAMKLQNSWKKKINSMYLFFFVFCVVYIAKRPWIMEIAIFVFSCSLVPHRLGISYSKLFLPIGVSLTHGYSVTADVSGKHFPRLLFNLKSSGRKVDISWKKQLHSPGCICSCRRFNPGNSNDKVTILIHAIYKITDKIISDAAMRCCCVFAECAIASVICVWVCI